MSSSSPTFAAQLSVLMHFVAWPFLAFSIWRLRRSHSLEIYLIWLSFCLAFTLYSIAQIYVGTDEALTRQLDKVLNFMFDVELDIELFATVLALAFIPQVLAYFLSGLSGSASSPKLVSLASDFVIWSLIKTLSAGSGVMISILAFGRDLRFKLAVEQAVLVSAWPVAVLATAFFLAWIYYCAGEAMSRMLRRPYFPFRLIHEIFTRHTTPIDLSHETQALKDAARKEIAGMVREGLREGIHELIRESTSLPELVRNEIREGMQELIRERAYVHELVRNTGLVDPKGSEARV